MKKETFENKEFPCVLRVRDTYTNMWSTVYLESKDWLLYKLNDDGTDWVADDFNFGDYDVFNATASERVLMEHLVNALKAVNQAEDDAYEKRVNNWWYKFRMKVARYFVSKGHTNIAFKINRDVLPF